MTFEELLQDMETHGVKLSVQSGDLLYDAPKDYMTAERREAFTRHKPDLVKLFGAAQRPEEDCCTVPGCDRPARYPFTLPDAPATPRFCVYHVAEWQRAEGLWTEEKP